MKTVAAIICSTVLLLGACSSDAKKTTSPTPSTTATSVPSAPESTTTVPTVATVATTVPPATVAAETTVAATVAPTPTEPAVTEPTADTTAPSTPDTSAATTPGTASASTEYVATSGPTMPSQTAKVAGDNSLPDGVYYATVGESGDPAPPAGSIEFEIVQLFRGDACTAHFGSDDPDACNDDYGVETNPTIDRPVPVADVYITVSDASTQNSYRISGDELASLLQGDPPAAGAPQDYTYSAFGYLLTVKGGAVTRLEQWWTP